jgi:hypothetical protein
LRVSNVGITDGWDFLITPVKMSSDAMIYTPGFIEIGSGIQKLIGGIYIFNRLTDTQIQRQYGDLMNLLLFCKNKESRLKTNVC